MGTDRFSEYETSCKCGQGKYVIECCRPDHPWASLNDKWYEAHIECSECKTIYQIEEHDKEFFLVKKIPSEKIETYNDNIHARCKQLMQTGEVKNLLKQLEQLTNSQESVAAIFCLLHDFKCIKNLTEENFCKKWNGSQEWIKDNIGVNQLEKVLKLLDLSIPSISQELDSIREMSRNKPTKEIISPPIYAVSFSRAANIMAGNKDGLLKCPNIFQKD